MGKNLLKIIENAFNNMTKDAKEFVDIEGRLKAAELIIPELAEAGIPSIGIGLDKHGNGIMIFKIDPTAEKDGKFVRIFDILQMRYNCESDHTYLHVGPSSSLYSWRTISFICNNVGDFKTIATEMKIVAYVMEQIENAETEFIKNL